MVFVRAQIVVMFGVAVLASPLIAAASVQEDYPGTIDVDRMLALECAAGDVKHRIGNRRDFAITVLDRAEHWAVYVRPKDLSVSVRDYPSSVTIFTVMVRKSTCKVDEVLERRELKR